jgi:uncharacterized repeat protein (TIGR03803 family)
MIWVPRDSKLAIHKAVALAGFVAVIAAITLAAAPLAHAQYTVIHNFGTPAGTAGDGSAPNGDMIQDSDGSLYGTTERGGDGVIFKLDPGGVLTVLYAFSCDGPPIGCFPEAGLFRDPEGNLYGTTTRGQHQGVFKLDTHNVATQLHEFTGGMDGSTPNSKLVSVDGELYGTTQAGGGTGCSQNLGCGTIFKVTKGGLETVVYRFTGGADGANPQGLIRDEAGNLYGVAEFNVTAPGAGTVFKLDTAGVFTVLYTFPGGAAGAGPVGRLARDTNGNIHGATRGGGTCCGVVFRLDSSGNETVLHDFFDLGGGQYPSTGVIDAGGVLYGTTEFGGDHGCHLGFSERGCGVLYQIGKTGEYTVLHRFIGYPKDGSWPLYGGLTLGADGSIYGATRKGGTGSDCDQTLNCGTIFKYTPPATDGAEVKP